LCASLAKVGTPSLVKPHRIANTFSLRSKAGQHLPANGASHTLPNLEQPVKLTVTSVPRLKLARGKHDQIFFDDDIAGFGLRLRDRGSYWVFQYSLGGNGSRLQRRMTFGAYPAMSPPKARERAEQLHAEVKLGRDPAGAKAQAISRTGKTFKACLDLYLARRRGGGKMRALRPSSYGEIERHLDRNLKRLHSLQIGDLSRSTIAAELSHFTDEHGPVQANRTRASLVKFLNWCAGEGFIDVNPAQFTNKNPEEARDRVLDNAELRKVWRALPDGDYGDIVKLLMLTGLRAKEISLLAWFEIDLEQGVISLPAMRMKNRRPHSIPITATMRAILEARPRDDGRDHVFGRGQGGFSGWSRCKERLDKAVKLPAWVIHDIRRSVATGMGEIGIHPHVIEAVLGHVSGTKAGVAGRYNKSTYEAEKAAALMRWDEHLMAAIEGRDANILPFKQA
jgi:integrase